MAMLNAIKELDPKHARQVLAAAALATAQEPILASRSGVLAENQAQAERVLGEIRDRLGISQSDDSGSSKEKINEFLTRAIRDSVFEGRLSSDILGAAGAEGRIPLASYSIGYHPIFDQVFRPLGIRRNLVEEVVTRPDEYEHIFSIPTKPEFAKSASLFLKRRELKRQKKDAWLLVQTQRNQATMVVQSAWWVLPDQVDLSGAAGVMDVMFAFLRRYGIPFTVNGVTGNPIFHYLFDTTPNTDVEFTSMLRTAPPNVLNSTAWAVDADSHKAEIALAYQVNLDAYADTLRRAAII